MIFTPTGDSLNGIIDFLFNKDLKLFPALVTTTATSVFTTNSWNYPHVLLNHKLDKSKIYNNWCSENKPNQSVVIHFTIYDIFITHYSLQTHGISTNYFIYNWFLEGSNDTISWFELHRGDNSTELHDKGIIKTFECTTKGSFRHFRITMTSKTLDTKNWHFILASIEFFGSIANFYNLRHTCTTINNLSHYFPIFFSVLFFISL